MHLSTVASIGVTRLHDLLRLKSCRLAKGEHVLNHGRPRQRQGGTCQKCSQIRYFHTSTGEGKPLPRLHPLVPQFHYFGAASTPAKNSAAGHALNDSFEIVTI